MGIPENSRGVWVCVLLVSVAVVSWADRARSEPPSNATDGKVVELGAALFSDMALSRDGRIACASCHAPEHAYADPRPLAIGVDGKKGTRNAPSLVGIADDTAFFWDGRRTQLDKVVLDPIANPAEFGWPTTDALLNKLGKDSSLVKRFERAFPDAKEPLSLRNLADALSAFVRSLQTGTSSFDQAIALQKPLPSKAELGRKLFEGPAQCVECHRLDGAKARLTDNLYHHSGIGGATQSKNLSQVSRTVADQNLDVNALGPKILSDPEWSALGRFNVSHQPSDIGAFRTPSLRNVAVTAPYMHDGSIETLRQAVDHEIYYRGFSRHRPITLSVAERETIVAFLETLTDSKYQVARTAQDTLDNAP